MTMHLNLQAPYEPSGLRLIIIPVSLHYRKASIAALRAPLMWWPGNVA